MNMQLIGLGMRKMSKEGYVEAISKGIKGYPTVYMTTLKGKNLLEDYNQYWQKAL